MQGRIAEKLNPSQFCPYPSIYLFFPHLITLKEALESSTKIKTTLIQSKIPQQSEAHKINFQKVTFPSYFTLPFFHFLKFVLIWLFLRLAFCLHRKNLQLIQDRGRNLKYYRSKERNNL